MAYRWVEDFLTVLLSEPESFPRAQERSIAVRCVAWLVVNVPAEWLMFFGIIGLIWCVTLVVRSAWLVADSGSRTLLGIASHVWRTILPFRPAVGGRNRVAAPRIPAPETAQITGRNPSIHVPPAVLDRPEAPVESGRTVESPSTPPRGRSRQRRGR